MHTGTGLLPQSCTPPQREDYAEADAINVQLIELAQRTKDQANKAGIKSADQLSFGEIINKATKVPMYAFVMQLQRLLTTI